MDVKNEAKAAGKGLTILLPVFIVLSAVAFVFAFSANTEVQKYKKMFEKEMAFRLDMEEKVNQLRNEKIELTSTIDSKDLEIKDKDRNIDGLNKVIDAKDEEIKNLKSTIEKINSLTKQATEQGQGPIPPQQSTSENTPETSK